MSDDDVVLRHVHPDGMAALWLHRAVAGRLVSNPDAVLAAFATRWRGERAA